MTRISPFLWFDDAAEEAARFYVSIFPNSKIVSTTCYEAQGAQVSGRPEGSVMTVAFQLDGSDFTALNGGPEFTFNESVSFVIECDDQAEVDHYWDRLTSDGGEESQCGWLKDRFGLSWQVVPRQLNELLSDPDPVRSAAAMAAMLQMKKIVINDLKKAADAA